MVQLSLNQIGILNLQTVETHFSAFNTSSLVADTAASVLMKSMLSAVGSSECPLKRHNKHGISAAIIYRTTISQSTGCLYEFCEHVSFFLDFLFPVFSGSEFLTGIRSPTAFFWSTLCLGFSDDDRL